MLTQDVRYAIRALRRTPVFTSVALASLALGLGATTAVFSIVNAVHFAAMPYPGADRMMVVSAADARAGCTRGCTRGITKSEFWSWEGRIASADAMAAMRPARAVAVVPDGADSLVGAEVSAGFFEMFGIQAAAGRTLIAADAGAADPVTVLGDASARKYFGGAAAAVGRAIRLDARSYLIVGVLPANELVSWPQPSGRQTDYFVPLRDGPESPVTFVARLRTAATPEALAGELNPRLDQTIAVTADAPHTWRARVLSLRGQAALRYQGTFGTMLGAVAFVLLIACVNLAGLFVTRLMSRQRELGIRAALGAGRSQLLRQMLTEVMVIATAGGVLGIGVAFAGAALARRLQAGRIPEWTTFAIDGRVLLFALGATVLTALVFGVWPAALISRRSLQRSVREAGGGVIAGGSRFNIQTIVVGLEIACTMVALAGAGVLVKTFLDAERRDLGMNRRDVLDAQVVLNAPHYASASERWRFAEGLLERAARIPGVLAVGLQGRGRGAPSLTTEGAGAAAPDSRLSFGTWEVTTDYFTAAGIAMIAGRTFTAADVPNAPLVAIIDEPTAQHLFPDGRALGRRLKLGPPSSPDPWMTVVGITATAHGDPLEPVRSYFPVLYRPLAQYTPEAIEVLLNIPGAPLSGVRPLRAIVKDLDPALPVSGVQTVNAVFEDYLWPLRLNTMVMSGFALFALALSAIGVAGVIAALVVTRTREIGIRIALGATRRSVLAFVMGAGLRLSLAGVVVGLIGSFALTRVLRTLLYGASTTNPLAFTGASLVFLVVALFATYLPARRALRVDPLTAFRPE